MPPPKLVPPAHLTGAAAARWHRGHKRLIGGAVINAAYRGIKKPQRPRLQRLLGNTKAKEEERRAELSVLEKSTGTLTKPISQIWSAPAEAFQ